ncbi:MAG: hypothetical protein IKC97_01095 [Clostridia bacterium]|nr:hypothetical protein [Clostridia bacterium]
MNKATLKRLFGSLAFRLLIVVLILYTVYHCVAAFSDRVVTDVVTSGVDRLTVRGQAVILRDETVLTVGNGNHLCSYPLENGAKVNATTTLAELYATYADQDERAQIQAALLALDRQIALAQQLPTADMLSSLPALQTLAREQLILNNRLTSANASMQDVRDGAFDLLLSLNRIGALTGQSGSSAALIASLRAERQKLLMTASYTAQTITLQSLGSELTGGYFFYAGTVDGYEAVFGRSSLEDMTVTDFDALMQASPRTYGNGVTVVGKLASSYAWSIALPVSYDVIDRVESGKSYDIVFRQENSTTVSMVLDHVISSEAEGRAILILSASTMPPNFTYTRFSDVELVLSEIEGYRVPETALATLDGKDGVYVLDGGRVTWRSIRILSRGDGYVLVYAPTKAEREDESDASYHYDRYLGIRDIVITDGDDLYDGKYIE